MESSGDELLRAEAELWCHAFGYLKSTALQCAIKLGIPNAIDRCGGAASLSDLHAAVPVTASKRACLSRLMRFLAVSGIFKGEEETSADGETPAGWRYSLTPVSRLLVIPDGNNDGSGGHACLSQLILLINSPVLLKASQCLADWLQKEESCAEAETPLTLTTMAHGRSLFSMVGTDVEFAPSFNKAMASDSRFLAQVVVRECKEVFTGVMSLVDVGGGDGTMARAIAKAFPHISCSVLELPHVVDAAPADDSASVEFIAGDIMEFIPPADALLLKWILHNWSDEDCVRILKRCKEAVSSREPKGKVVIIDVVLGSQSKQMLEAQLDSDLCMMLLTTGEERCMEQWQRIFHDAGFTQYKISPVLGFRSLIELYP